MGVKLPRAQARLLETVDLTMESALKIALSMEKAEEGIHQFKTEKEHGAAEKVDFVGSGTRHKKKMTGKPHQKEDKPSKKFETKKGHAPKDANSFKYKNVGNKEKIVCFRCGGNHLAPSCRLPKNIKCNHCGGFGHLSRVCKKKGQTNYIEDIAAVEKAEEHGEHRSQFSLSLFLENIKVKFNVDCGAAVTLVNHHWLKAKLPELKIFKT